MNKTELISAMAQAAGTTKAAAGRLLDAFLETTTQKLRRGESIVLPGFCTLATGSRAARTGRNPQTGAVIQIKASRVVKFRAGKRLKEAVQKG